MNIFCMTCLLITHCTIFYTFWSRYNLKKLSYEERKAKLVARLQALNSAANAADDDEDDEEWNCLVDLAPHI